MTLSYIMIQVLWSSRSKSGVVIPVNICSNGRNVLGFPVPLRQKDDAEVPVLAWATGVSIAEASIHS